MFGNGWFGAYFGDGYFGPGGIGESPQPGEPTPQHAITYAHGGPVGSKSVYRYAHKWGSPKKQEPDAVPRVFAYGGMVELRGEVAARSTARLATPTAFAGSGESVSFASPAIAAGSAAFSDPNARARQLDEAWLLSLDGSDLAFWEEVVAG